MAPQFVDFNADGNIDIVTGTFDGSPHVALGTGKGFAKPGHILMADDSRIMLSAYWDFPKSSWEATEDGFPAGMELSGEHCCSAVAFDWDGDGDHDLLLGDKKTGAIFFRINEGTAQEPDFSDLNEPVLVGGKPLALPGGLTSPEVVDWDGDGLLDLLVGSYTGDDRKQSGGIWLLRNTGTKTEPAFAATTNLIPCEPMGGATSPQRPEEGLYCDAKDVDGDGVLDLLVGGYSNYESQAVELSPEQKARLEELDALIAELTKEMSALTDPVFEDGDSETLGERFKALRETEEFKTVEGKIRAAEKEVDTLRPSPKRTAGVWLYRGLGK